MSTKNNMSVGADEAPKFKLSEIVAAMDDDRIELDCKAILSVRSSTQSISMLNVKMLDITEKHDQVLMLIFGGLSRLMHEAIKWKPEALAAFAEAMGREEAMNSLKGSREERIKELIKELIKALVGKEDCHE